MKGGGSVVAVTPRRFKPSGENINKNGDPGPGYTPLKKETQRDSTEEPTLLSPLNINAISRRSVHRNRHSVKPNVNQIKQAQTPSTGSFSATPNESNPTVVWNNAIFEDEGEERAPKARSSRSDSDRLSVEVTSHGIGDKDKDKNELHAKNLSTFMPVESTPVSHSSNQNCAPDLESICSSVDVPSHRKQGTQPMKRVLFSVENLEHNSVAGEFGESKSCLKESVDNGIDQIDKEIFQLTKRLNELKIQKAAIQKDKESQGPCESQKEVGSSKKSVKRDGSRGPKVEEPKSLEKQRRGRTVSAKFLQWDSSKGEKKSTDSLKRGKRATSPKNVRRRALSLGPSEHLRYSELSSKDKEDEFGIQKCNNGLSKKWPRGIQNSKSAFREKGCSGLVDIRARSFSLSPVRRHPTERKGSNLRPGLEGSMSARKTGVTPKKISQVSDAKGSINPINSVLGNTGCPVQQLPKLSPYPDQQPQKPSPCFKSGRVVASRYAQVSTTLKDKDARTPQSSLNSIKNAYGKRLFQIDDLEQTKGNSPFCKKRPAVARSPSLRSTPTDKMVLMPRSSAPGKIGAKLETKKTTSILSKDDKVTATSDRQDIGGTNGIVFAAKSISDQVNPFNKNMPTDNQETLIQGGSKAYFFTAGTKSPDAVEQNRLYLPMIRTTRFSENSPRDSGCIKRAVECIGKKSFFASDENEGTCSTGVKPDKLSTREIADDIKHAFSFEDDEVEI